MHWLVCRSRQLIFQLYLSWKPSCCVYCSASYTQSVKHITDLFCFKLCLDMCATYFGLYLGYPQAGQYKKSCKGRYNDIQGAPFSQSLLFKMLKHIILTYLLAPRCRVLLEKLTGLQLVKKFPAFYGTRGFITALTSVRHLSLSWDTCIAVLLNIILHLTQLCVFVGLNYSN